MAKVLQLSFPQEYKAKVTACLQRDPAVGQFYIFSGVMVDATDPEAPPLDICRIEYSVEARRISHAIKQLRLIGLGESFGDIDVMPISCSTQALPHMRRRNIRCCRSLMDRMPTLEIHTAVLSSSHLTAEHVILVFLASGMAACGLLMDNLVLILASFFVSPLMNMILALTWGLVISDSALVRRGLKNTVSGALLSFAAGAGVALMLTALGGGTDSESLSAGIDSGTGIYYGISINTEQVRMRGPPCSTNIIGALIIGSISGVAIALGQSSGIASALSGVTLSASLLPPVVNCGMMLVFSLVYPDLRTRDGYLLRNVGLVSLALYAVNVFSIIVFAYVTFKLKRISGLTLRSQGVGPLAEQEDDELESDGDGARETASPTRRRRNSRWRPSEDATAAWCTPTTTTEIVARTPARSKREPRTPFAAAPSVMEAPQTQSAPCLSRPLLLEQQTMPLAPPQLPPPQPPPASLQQHQQPTLPLDSRTLPRNQEQPSINQ